MPLPAGLFSIYTRFLSRSTPKDCLDRLPNDVIVDFIFDYLDIVDIIRMRMVSKLYYQLSRHPVIWKRALRRADVPLPPIAPSTRHTPSAIPGADAERLLIRAYSLDRNWQRSNPRTLKAWGFDSHYHVSSMALLPGGQFLVASVSTNGSSHFSLCVFSMDNNPPRPLAAFPLKSKAYDIQAKYMTIEDKPSIVVAFLRRVYHHKKDKKKEEKGRLQNVSEYSTYHQIDSSVVFRYECEALHAPLENLETLTHSPYSPDTMQYREWARSLPKPFTYLVSVTSRSQLSSPVLEIMYGSPYFAVVKGNNNIIFKRLGGGAAATLTCRPQAAAQGQNHVIKAMKLLPNDHAVFVIREVTTPNARNARPGYLFETFHALQCGTEKISQELDAEQSVLSRSFGTLSHIYVPDWPSSSRKESFCPPRPAPAPPNPNAAGPSSAGPARARDQAPEPSPPPPLCVYARQAGEEELLRVLFHAQRYVWEPPPSPISPGNSGGGGAGAGAAHRRRHVVYRTNVTRNQTYWQPCGGPDAVLRIVPAARRPLLVQSAWDDLADAPAVLDVRPFVDRGWERPRAVVGDVVSHAKGWIGSPAFDGEARNAMVGARVQAWAWDETVGRLVVAREGTRRLAVFDFAAAPLMDDRERYAHAARMRQRDSHDVVMKNGVPGPLRRAGATEITMEF